MSKDVIDADLLLIDKKSQRLLDSISLTSMLFYNNFFEDPANVLSYSTKVNANKQIVDNYFGDIVVADLNFDMRDDIAVIADMGGNGGPEYRYYLQNKERKFKETD